MKRNCFILSLIVLSNLYAENINTVKLNQTVISNSGFETTSRETTKNMTVISEDDFESKNYTEISDVLKNVPGVSINENTFGSYVDLRGQGMDKAKSNVQILVDGVNINPLDPAHGVLPLDTIPLSSIERIEILPGGGSVIYGDGTVGGAINIITKIEAGKTYNKIGARFGSDKTFNYNVAVGQKINDKLAMQLAYNKDKTDGYRDGDKKEGEYFEGAFNYKITDKNDVTFKYTRYDGKSYSLDSLTKKEVDEDRKQSGYNPALGPWETPQKLKLKRDSYTLNFRNKLTDKIQFDLDTSYQETENRWYSVMETYKKPWDRKHIGTDSDGVFKDKKVQISPKLKLEYGEGSQLIVGVDYKKNTAKRESLHPGYLGRYLDYNYNMKKESIGAYIFNKTKIEKFEFTQGFRREKTKYNADRYTSEYALMWPEPVPTKPVAKRVTNNKIKKRMTNDAYELGVNYLYSDTGNVYARYEHGFRTPAPSQFTDKVKKGRGTIYKENNLKEETYNSFEIGTKDYIFGSYVSLTGFYTETKDEIIQIGKMPKYWEFLNLGKTERKGIELQTEQYFNKLTLTESFSYIDAKIKKGSGKDGDSNKGKYIPGVSKYSASLAAKYDFTEKLNTVLTLTYKDGYYLDEANRSGKVNKRFTTDLTVNYTLENGLKLYAGVNNIFADKYYNNVHMEDNTIYYDPAAERTYYAGFEYKF